MPVFIISPGDPVIPAVFDGNPASFLLVINVFSLLVDQCINERHWVPAKNRGNDGKEEPGNFNGGVYADSGMPLH